MENDSKWGNILPHKLENGPEIPNVTTPSRPKRQGNYKAGPGRPPGSKNKKTLALEAAAREAAASIDEAFEGDAHAFLQAVYRDPKVPLEIRIMAAGRALRVEKPTLSASQSVTDVNVNIGARLDAARERLARLDGPRPDDKNGGGIGYSSMTFDATVEDAETI